MTPHGPGDPMTVTVTVIMMPYNTEILCQRGKSEACQVIKLPVTVTVTGRG
jgi:hypothetical protein